MASETQKLELIQMILKLQDELVLARVKNILKNASAPSNTDLPVVNSEAKKTRPFGFAKGLITYVSTDFDETPTGFEDYPLPS